MAAIEIRPVTGIDDLFAIEAIQQKVWGVPDRAILPMHFLRAAPYNGGCLIGAYDGDRIVGFVLGIIATVEGLNRIDQVAAARLKMHSVMMGVLPEYQGQGIGWQLKVAQRDFAHRIGIRLITWTFDPLMARNAWLNIGKLGCISGTYERNFYGVEDSLDADRLVAEWWITGNRARSRVRSQRKALSLDAFIGGGAELVNEALFDPRGLPVPATNFFVTASAIALIELPADFPQLHRQDLALARRWRKHLRDVVEHFFERNYIVTDFVRHTDAEGRRRTFYVVARRDA